MWWLVGLAVVTIILIAIGYTEKRDTEIDWQGVFFGIYLRYGAIRVYLTNPYTGGRYVAYEGTPICLDGFEGKRGFKAVELNREECLALAYKKAKRREI